MRTLKAQSYKIVTRWYTIVQNQGQARNPQGTTHQASNFGRDWFAAQVSLARMQHLGWARTGSMHIWSCCLLAWIRRNRIDAADVWLPGILHAPSPLTYTLASCARQAAEKRVSFSFLGSLARRGLLHVKIQAQLGVQSTKRLRPESHEPGWAIYS
jgi:hypothetical protein